MLLANVAGFGEPSCLRNASRSIRAFCSNRSSCASSGRSLLAGYSPPMNPSEIQTYRKRRLKEAIERFFGSNIALARRLRNKDGEPLKDGSYVGHLLREDGQPGARPIDEDRVREIEALKPELKGWFSLPDNSAPTTLKHQPYSAAHHYSSDKNAPTAPVISWGSMGDFLYTDNNSFRVSECLPIPEGAAGNCKWTRVESDHPRFRIMRGDLIALEPLVAALQAVDGKVHLFRALDGRFFLGEFRRLADGGYEALPDSGMPLDSKRHGVTVVARKRGQWE